MEMISSGDTTLPQMVNNGATEATVQLLMIQSYAAYILSSFICQAAEIRAVLIVGSCQKSQYL